MVDLQREIGMEILERWIQTLLWEHRVPGVEPDLPVHVLRLKGVLAITGCSRRIVVQGVNELYDKVCVMMPWSVLQ